MVSSRELLSISASLNNCEVIMLVPITSEWQSINTLTGQAVGTAMLVQSQSSSRVFVKQQDAAPEPYSPDAVILEFLNLWQVTAGSRDTWVRVADTAGQLFVEVL